MRRLIAICMSVTLALALGSVRHPARADDPVFKIGVVASLSGAFAIAAKDSIDGVQAWAKNRGLPGKKIVFETLDDETNPVNAANAFRRLASDPDVKLIYLLIPSNSALAVKSFASEYKIPIISGGGADTLGVPADPWLFKVSPANRDYMIAVSEYMKKKGYKRLASLYSTDAYGQFDISNLRDLAPKYGYEIVAAESFAVEDTNFNAQIARIRAAKPDLIYSSASGRASILFFKQYQQLGITTPLIMTGAAISKPFFDALGGADKADGVMTSVQLGVFGPKIGGDTARLYAEMEKTLGHTPAYFNAFGYDVGLITEAAVAGSDGTRQGIRDALEKLQNLPAVNGPVTYRPGDHTGQDNRSIAIGKMINGVAVPAD
jgi:branched-chain amino acid transport system substrate-binding protein